MPSPHTRTAGSSGGRMRATHILLETVAVVALAALIGCDTPGVTLVQPDVATSRDSVIFHARLEDSVLAAALGWEQGVPGVEIQLHRTVDRFLPTSVYTDSAGDARIPSPLPGLYKIAAYRVLSETETGPTGGVVRAFGDGLKQQLSGAGKVLLSLAADRPGSLVISEVYDGGGTPELRYGWAGFTELYNNSDTTVYLDGMLLGWAFGISFSNVLRCEDNLAFREDPSGLWVREFHQFPGIGTDYPAAPRQAVTIAMDAVDHSQVDLTLPDLSHADFELAGSADPDNPNVPNMPPRGIYTDPRGHGMVLLPTLVNFLAAPLDVNNLETRVHMNGHRYVRIPSERILDTMHAEWESPSSGAVYTPTYSCLNWVNREFDRLEAVVYRPDNENRTSLHRKVLRTVAGAVVLLDLNTSRLDFVMGLYGPGTIGY